MAVTHDDVRRIAALARLAVPDERLDALAGELSGILRHVDALSRVPTESTAAAALADHVEREPGRAPPPPPQQPGMRVALDSGPPVPLTHPHESFAPAWRDGFFLVPRLDTHGTPDASDTPHAP
jgi:aspartyl-tRNA(Asn)/glutamyl-tRNA(Gln) amidotransferase subunit C